MPFQASEDDDRQEHVRRIIPTSFGHAGPKPKRLSSRAGTAGASSCIRSAQQRPSTVCTKQTAPMGNLSIAREGTSNNSPRRPTTQADQRIPRPSIGEELMELVRPSSVHPACAASALRRKLRSESTTIAETELLQLNDHAAPPILPPANQQQPTHQIKNSNTGNESRESVLLTILNASNRTLDEDLTNAAAVGNINMLMPLLQKLPRTMYSGKRLAHAIHAACRAGHHRVVQFLLASVKHRGRRACATHSIGSDGTLPLHVAAYAGHRSVAKVLIEYAGATIDSMDCYGDTPLALAARKGHCELVELLLLNGASPTHANRFGDTPCDQATDAPKASLTLRMLRAAECGHATWTLLPIRVLVNISKFVGISSQDIRSMRATSWFWNDKLESAKEAALAQPRWRWWLDEDGQQPNADDQRDEDMGSIYPRRPKSAAVVGSNGGGVGGWMRLLGGHGDRDVDDGAVVLRISSSARSPY